MVGGDRLVSGLGYGTCVDDDAGRPWTFRAKELARLRSRHALTTCPKDPRDRRRDDRIAAGSAERLADS